MSGEQLTFAVLISANGEWRAVKALFPGAVLSRSPFGEYFFANAATADDEPVLFFEGGWGKVAAAASTQYVIDHFAAENVVIYDIHEAMGDDPRQGVSHYTTEIDLPAEFKELPKLIRMLRRSREAALDISPGRKPWV